MTRRRYNPNPDAAWYARHASLSGTRKAVPEASKRRLLRVSTGYFVAGAVWQKVSGVWSCVRAAPILNWMRGKTPAEAHLVLLKMGADYRWSDI